MMEQKLDTFEELMLELLAGNLSQEGEQKLTHFLESDISYQQQYKEMARTRAKALVGKFEQEKQANYDILAAKLGLKKKSEKRKLLLWRTFSRVAAIALLVLAASITGYYIYNDIVDSNQEMVLCQMEVPLGSQTKVVLPDGSVVCLNSGSILKYDPDFLRKKNREVYLVGEGYFEVQKNQGKPFIVHADDINIKVLGTVFNVRSYPDDSEIEVSLIEGRVNVFSVSETQGNVILSHDEQLTYDKRSGKMSHCHTDALLASQWTTGRLSFVNASVAEIMKDIERKYNVRIIIRSKYLNKEVFSGSISSKLTIEEILDYMDVDNKYSWNRSGNVITITDK